MQRMLLGWWVLELTDSPYLLGVVSALNTLPMMFGIASGIVIDRFDRRKVLIAAESLGVISSLPIALTAAVGWFQFWQIPLVSFLSGLAFAFGFSARAALLPDLVDKSQVVKAMSLLMIFWNGAFILGPYTGGALLEKIGYAGCFTLLGVAFVVEILVLLLVPGSKPLPKTERSITRELVEGAKYIRGNQGIMAILLMSALWNLFITPYQTTLLPIIARDVLGLDAAGLGVLEGGIGLGSLLASVFLMGMRDFKRSGWMAIINSGLVGVFFLFLSMSRSFTLSLFLLVLSGFVNALINTMSQTPLLVHTADDKRGIVMGVRGQAIATMPVGSLMMGVEAGAIGSPFALALSGVSYALIMLGVAASAPRFRQME